MEYLGRLLFGQQRPTEYANKNKRWIQGEYAKISKKLQACQVAHTHTMRQLEKIALRECHADADELRQNPVMRLLAEEAASIKRQERAYVSAMTQLRAVITSIDLAQTTRGCHEALKVGLKVIDAMQVVAIGPTIDKVGIKAQEIDGAADEMDDGDLGSEAQKILDAVIVPNNIGQLARAPNAPTHEPTQIADKTEEKFPSA